MNLKKLASNLIWIAALVFLAWFFLFPVSLSDAMPPEEGFRISVLDRDEAGTPIQTIYYLPADSAANDDLRALLGNYPCYRTINTNGKVTDQALTVNRSYLIETDSATDFIYAHGGSKVTLNDDYLRMGWYNSKQSTAFAAELQQILEQTDTGVVVEDVQVVEAADSWY